MEYSLGDVVCSVKGRDARKHFIIVKVIDEQYVLIADGALHKLAKPKKKKVKHLKSMECSIEQIAQKLKDETKVFDSEVRNAIESLNLTNKGEE